MTLRWGRGKTSVTERDTWGVEKHEKKREIINERLLKIILFNLFMRYLEYITKRVNPAKILFHSHFAMDSVLVYRNGV